MEKTNSKFIEEYLKLHEVTSVSDILESKIIMLNFFGIFLLETHSWELFRFNNLFFNNNGNPIGDCYNSNPEDFISNSFDFTLAMKPEPNYWEDLDAEWLDILNEINNN